MSEDKDKSKEQLEDSEFFVNPIDEDKITENPSTLPYAHTVGGVVIKPEDKGRIKGRALAAMEDQTQMQMDQIREQIELLAKQAEALKKRKEISQMIYGAEMSFEPLINHIYHLYLRKNGKMLLSMVAPTEWGRKLPFERFVATVRLLADHTWEILEEND